MSSLELRHSEWVLLAFFAYIAVLMPFFRDRPRMNWQPVIMLVGVTAFLCSIAAAQKTVTCPGRKRTDNAREGTPGTYEDGDPVNIRLGAMRIGNIALTSVDAELYSPIAMRLKRESPIANTFMVTLANGAANSGYIPNDTAFGALTFQVLGSKLKPGCAETAIVEGLVDLISTTQK